VKILLLLFGRRVPSEPDEPNSRSKAVNSDTADALEDAGCTDAELLGHLRRPWPHARGCWVVDLILGKS
jgi:hypothetical protein